MTYFLPLIALAIAGLASTPAAALNLSAFPKIPYAVREACIIGDQFYFLTTHAVLQGSPNKAKWDLHPVIQSPPEDRLWSMTCTPPISTTFVRNGVWRSGDQAVSFRKKMKLPRGSSPDNWTQLANGDVAVLRDRHVEIFTNGPRWKLRQRLPGGGQTTLCAESQPGIWSSIGELVCRQLPPLEWQDRLIVAQNKILLDQVLSQVPMIEHSEVHVMQWDTGLESFQIVGTLGPLPGELASYFIDKNPVDGRETLFLVVLMRSGADAWGGLTQYSVLVPVPLDTLPKATAQ